MHVFGPAQGPLQFVHADRSPFGFEGVDDFAGAHRSTLLQEQVNPRHRFAGDALLLRPAAPRHGSVLRQRAMTVCSDPRGGKTPLFRRSEAG